MGSSARSLAPRLRRISPGWLVVAAVAAAAFVERAVNFGRWPIGFRETLEFDSANSARTIFLSITPHTQPWQQTWLDQHVGRFIEPPLTQALTVLTYLPDGVERPWTSWIFTVAFWFAGSAILFAAVRRLAGFWGAALALAYILLLPFGVGLSQSFQPEALLLLSLSAVIWYSTRGDVTQGRRIVVAGVLGALAALAKPGALLPFITMMYVYSAVQGTSLRDLRSLLDRGKLLRLAILVAAITLPAVLYAFVVIPQHLGQKVIPSLLLTPDYYRHLAGNAIKAAGILPLLGAALGFVVAPKLRLLTVAYGIAYAGYCAIFTYHSMTHDYYQLALLPIVAILLGGLGQWLAEVVGRVKGRTAAIRGLAAAAAVVVSVAFTYGLALRMTPDYLAWTGPDCKVHQECAADQARFQAIGQSLGPGEHVLVYSPDYGKPLAYFSLLTVTAWPDANDLKYEEVQGKPDQSEEQRLDAFIAQENPHYFVITTPDICPTLVALLDGRYTLVEGDSGVRVYDLTKPLQPAFPASISTP